MHIQTLGPRGDSAGCKRATKMAGVYTGHTGTWHGAGTGPALSALRGCNQGTALPVCCALTAQERAVWEGFLEEVSAEAHRRDGSESGKEGPLAGWSPLRKQQGEGTALSAVGPGADEG